MRDTDPDTILKIAGAVVGLAVGIKGLVGIGSAVVGIAEFASALAKLGKLLGIGGAVAEGASAAGGVASGVSGLGAAMSALSGPVGIAIVAIAAIVAAVVYLWNTNEKFRDSVKQTWEDIKAAVGAVVDWFSTEVIGRLKDFWDTLVEDTSTTTGALGRMLQTFGNTWGEYWEAIKTFCQGVWDTITGIIEGALDIILGALRIWLGLVSGDWSTAWDGIKQIWDGFWKGGTKLVQGSFQILTSIFGAALAVIKNIWDAFWAIFNISPNSSLGKFVASVSDALAAASRWFSQWPSKVKQAFNGSGTWLWQAGKNIISGLLDGLRSGWHSVTGWFSRATASIPKLKGPENVDKALLISSGRWVMQGFQKGLESQYGSVRSSLKNLTATLADDVDVAPVVDKLNDAASIDLGAANPTDQAIRPVQVNITNNYPVAADESKQRDDVAEAIRLGANL